MKLLLGVMLCFIGGFLLPHDIQSIIGAIIVGVGGIFLTLAQLHK